ncbi:hypothetical protein BDW75DRAFT_249738 [Aspergillus navahoensis]
MASSIKIASSTPTRAPVEPKGDPKATASSYIREPLKYSGSLDGFKSFDVTPITGREFPDLQLTDILNDDQKIRDLAISVSRRGVVFFRNQHISSDEQKVLGQKLGELTGKPASKLTVNENGKLDDEISVISSETNRKYYGDRFANDTRHLASEGWHAEYPNPSFNNIAKEHGIELIQGDRGAPENTGPLVRTNPVTGWKSLFGAAGQVDNGWIEGVTKRESEILKTYSENHDLQVRFKWGTNDLAIWDNRSVSHTATNDYDGKRQ